MAIIVATARIEAALPTATRATLIARAAYWERRADRNARRAVSCNEPSRAVIAADLYRVCADMLVRAGNMPA